MVPGVQRRVENRWVVAAAGEAAAEVVGRVAAVEGMAALGRFVEGRGCSWVAAVVFQSA